ncbi:MAG: insulinase family protein [Prevotellaceae bacterium]|jgi:zinc protease|nr:insulinase family protein [Prevotellaceae bacterium]
MKKHLLLTLSLMLSLNLLAQTKIPMDPAIRYGKLSNGLTYYIRHNEHPSQRADFFLVQNVGAILEEDNQNGFAHFLEHMAFNGTKNFPGKSLANYMESIGVKYGANLNAGTSQDRTIYKITNVPVTRSGIIDSSLLILHDWSGFISLDGEEIDKERGVILEEWRKGYSTAGRRMREESSEQRYPGSQYAKRNVLGDTAIIQHFNYDELRDFQKKWYRPDLQALIIVGDIDVDQIEANIKRQFADIPAPVNPAKRIIYDIPDNKEPIIALVTDPEASTTNINLSYKHKPLPNAIKLSEEGYDIGLVEDLIAFMIDGRKRTGNNSPFVSQSGSYRHLVPSTDAFMLSASAKEGKEKPAIETLLKEAQRIKRYGFTQSELDRAKIKLSTAYEKFYKERDKQTNNSYVQEYIRNFLEAEHIADMAWYWEYVQKALAEKIDSAMVNRIAKSYITDENLIVSITAPEKIKDELPSKEDIRQMIEDAKRSDIKPYKDKQTDKVLLKEKPEAGTIVKETQNNIFGSTEWILSNGIKVILKPTAFKNDEINLYAFSEGGYSLVKNVEDLPSARSANAIVSQGNWGGISSNERSLILTGKLAGVSTKISAYGENMSGRSSVKDAETMFQLLYLKFTDVSPNKKAFASYIQKMKTSYANKEDAPKSAFQDTVRIVSSNYSPRTILMDTAMINKISASKAYSIYKERFGNPADFTFVLIGNIDLDSIKPLVTTYLGGLETSSEHETWEDTHVRYPKGKIDKEWTREMPVEKTSVSLVYTGGMKYSYENSVLANALGNILKLRYTESIREEEGGTYGVAVLANLTDKPQEQLSLSISFDTDPQKADKLIGIAQQELENIRKNGVRADDLEKVKMSRLKTFTESQQTNKWWQSAIVAYERSGFNWINDYERLTNELSSEKIQQMLEALLSQGNCIKFVMSPKK